MYMYVNHLRTQVLHIIVCVQYMYILSAAITSAVFASGIALGEYVKVAMVSLNSEHGDTFFFASFSTSSAGICVKHTSFTLKVLGSIIDVYVIQM